MSSFVRGFLLLAVGLFRLVLAERLTSVVIAVSVGEIRVKWTLSLVRIVLLCLRHVSFHELGHKSRSELEVLFTDVVLKYCLQDLKKSASIIVSAFVKGREEHLDIGLCIYWLSEDSCFKY